MATYYCNRNYKNPDFSSDKMSVTEADAKNWYDERDADGKNGISKEELKAFYLHIYKEDQEKGKEEAEKAMVSKRGGQFFSK